MNPPTLSVGFVLHDSDNESLIGLLERVLGGFVASVLGYYGDGPFLSIDEYSQGLWLNVARNKSNLRLGGL